MVADDDFLDNAAERRSTEDTELIDMVEIANTGEECFRPFARSWETDSFFRQHVSELLIKPRMLIKSKGDFCAES